ncbi:hypothetical protein PRNP1_015131 [Phytophthora ramorum]
MARLASRIVTLATACRISSSCTSTMWRVIKWARLKARRRDGQKRFCYLEYAGKRKPHAAASSVVGFCAQGSIARGREVPTLERYDILRGQFVRTGSS